MPNFSRQQSQQQPDDDALSSLLLLLKQTNGTNETEQQNSAIKAPRPPVADYSRQSESDGTMATTLTLEELRKYFHLPIVEVARQLGTCTTALKKICRKHKILKWPYRQIRSLTKSIQSLEMAGLNDSITDELKQQYREQIMTLQKAIDDIVYDPNTNISDLAKKLETEWGNGMNEEKWNGTNEPSENVRQLIQAAAATVSVEGSNSNSRSSHSSNSKRKYAQVEDKMTLGSNENDTSIIVTEVGIPQSSSQSQSSSYSYQTQPSTSTSVSKTPAEMVNIGLTQVSHVTLAATDSKNSTIHFVGPVVLAPLERRRISKQASKKLVPLIEPDICNHFKMEFLPQSTILEIKYFRTISLSPNLQGNINTIDMNGGIIDMQQHHQQQHHHHQQQQQEYQQQHHYQQQQQQQIHAYDPSNIELDMRYNNNININNINNGNNNMGIVVNDSNGTEYQETE